MCQLELQAAFNVDKVAAGVRTILKTPCEFGKPWSVSRYVEHRICGKSHAEQSGVDLSVPMKFNHMMKVDRSFVASSTTRAW